MKLTHAAAALLLLAPLPGHATTALCNGSFSGIGANRSALATIGGAAPCPVPAETVTIGNVGTGTGVDGKPVAITYSLQPYSSGLALTSNTAILMGTSNNRTITFGRATVDPYFIFSFIDPGTTYTFTQQFELIGANRATRNGQTMQATNAAGNTAADGFAIKLLGTYSTATFSMVNLSGTPSSGFTTAIAATPTPPVTGTPGPLAVAGAAVAWRTSRKLRKRIKQC